MGAVLKSLQIYIQGLAYMFFGRSTRENLRITWGIKLVELNRVALGYILLSRFLLYL